MSVQVADKPVESVIPLNGKHVPPLQAGAYMTRPEFERRYHAHPEIKKAELIEAFVTHLNTLRSS